uniref:Uncharacterized protein n=1 Tax=Knipowitschia caucasica TaxID=637954 RepID=A0AAV2J265_KNICA
MESVKQTLKEEKQALSTELQSVKTTLRTVEKRAEDDGQRKDSLLNDAGFYIDELNTKMQDQEMHLRKEMEERTN